MAKYIFGGIAVIIVIFIVVVAMQPDVFQVSRSATFAASPDKVFAQVNDLHNWHAWSPWARLDPNAKPVYDGAPAGVGAIMSWDGNMQVGKGSMTITDSTPNELIKFRLDFEKPMKATNTAVFTFKGEGDQTAVTWSMQGQNNFIGKAMGLIFNCEKIVGTQFEQGLANLKEVVEAK